MTETPAFDKARLVWTLPWDADWVTAVAFAGSHRRLVAGNNRGEMLLWELPEKAEGDAPKPGRKLTGHTNVINRLITTKDGSRLYSCSNDRTIRVWDMKADGKGEETLVLNAAARERAGKRGGGKMPAAIEAKVQVQSSQTAYTEHADWVVGMGLSHDEKVLASGDDGGAVMIRDTSSGKVGDRWAVKGWAYALALSPDCKRVFVSERLPLVFDSGRHDGVRIWDRESKKPALDLGKDYKSMYISAAAWSADGKLLALGRGGECDGNNGVVFLVDPATGKKVKTLTPGHLNGLTDLAFHPDGKHLASCGRDTVVSIWNIADGKRVTQLGKPRGGQFKDWLHALSISPDGKWLAAGDMAGSVQVWSLGG